MHSLRCTAAVTTTNTCWRRLVAAYGGAAATATTTIRAFGSRGARGHGWYVKYRAGEGGRHLQGEYHDRPSTEECEAWNATVLSMGSVRAYMDLVVEPKKANGESIYNNDDDTTERQQSPHMAKVPSVDSLTAPKQRLEMDIAAAVMPDTCHNFTTLIQNQDYKSTLLYRFEKQVGVCGGDILTNTGKTGRSHRTDRLSINVKADPLPLWHTAGTVSMLVSSVDEIDSRFFLCTAHSPHLDGIHRAFGRLTPESLAIVQELQNSLLTRGGGIPTSYDLIIADAGIVSSEAGQSTTADETARATAL